MSEPVDLSKYINKDYLDNKIMENLSRNPSREVWRRHHARQAEYCRKWIRELASGQMRVIHTSYLLFHEIMERVFS